MLAFEQLQKWLFQSTFCPVLLFTWGLWEVFFFFFYCLLSLPPSILPRSCSSMRSLLPCGQGRQRDIVIDIYVQSGALPSFFGGYLHRCSCAIQVNHITKSEFKRMNTDTYDFNLQNKKEYGCEGRKTVLMIVYVTSWQLIRPQMYWY